MTTNLNLHSAYFAQVNALVARRGSLKVISQAMWQMDFVQVDTNQMRKQMCKHNTLRIMTPRWDGIGIDCR